jgi:hypothetical protein
MAPFRRSFQLGDRPVLAESVECGSRKPPVSGMSREMPIVTRSGPLRVSASTVQSSSPPSTRTRFSWLLGRDVRAADARRTLGYVDQIRRRHTELPLCEQFRWQFIVSIQRLISISNTQELNPAARKDSKIPAGRRYMPTASPR